MINFKTVRYKNFLSVGNNFLEISLNNCRMTAIKGANGSGKSVFLDAITFALFGKAFRKINKPQLVNTINRKDCLVEIQFDVRGKEYLVRRGIKPNIFEIYENGTLIEQEARSDDYQEMLETTIIRMNYSAFTQTVVIGHATYSSFLKLTPVQRREVVEKLLDIDIFTKMNVFLKDMISEAKENLNIVQADERVLTESVNIHKDLLQKSESSVETQLNHNEHTLSELLAELSQKTAELEKDQNSLLTRPDHSSKLNKLKKKMTQLEEYQTTFRIKTKNLSKEIKFMSENDVCSVCHQNIDGNFKDSYILQKTEELSKLNDGITLARNEITSTDSEIDSLMAEDSLTEQIKRDILLLKNDILSIEKQIAALKDANQRLQQEKILDMVDTRTSYETAVSKMKECQQRKDEILSTQHLNSLATILLKDDGIKTKIIRNYLPLMNKSINKYLEMMDFFVNLHLNDEFEEVIKTPNRADFSYNSFSEGQKMRIDIAILFTWREISRIKNSVNTNLLILDEVYDSSLDATGVDDFMKILRGIRGNTNVFIISHKDEILSEKFDRTIKVEMKTGFTQVRYS